MTTWDPELTDDDRGWLEAWVINEAARCPGCKQPLDECRDEANMGRYSVVSEHCQACRVQQAQAEADHANDVPQRGLYYGVQKS